jgi:1-deoxy-D-xylulose-5-phosphate reductoisomerase
MNKGLELIEAHFLFALPPEKLDVLVHPQSIVHCLVSYEDGTTLAHLSAPDMRTPIAHALGFPDRIESGVRPLNFFEVGTLNFEAPDLTRFPCLRLAYAALEAGESGPVTLNAANEVAVERFLRGELSFDRIPGVIEDVLSRVQAAQLRDLQHVLEVDLEARTVARSCVKEVEKLS